MKKTAKGLQTNKYGELVPAKSRKKWGSTPLTPAIARQLRADLFERELGQIINRAASDILSAVRAEIVREYQKHLPALKAAGLR